MTGFKSFEAYANCLALPMFAAMSLRPSDHSEVRKKVQKVSFDADEARRKREDNLVEI